MLTDLGIIKDVIIEGKWYCKKFRAIKLLGEGGTASIYLVKEIPTGAEYAMKISGDMINIDSEYKTLKKLKGIKFIPQAYYRDDCTIGGISYYFFIMSYYRGKNLKQISSEKQISLKSVLQAVLIIADICHQLNYLNIFYCDLKPENLIFDCNSHCIFLIDFGGIVKKGESISHFTPFFDRASWGKGERVADENYQIFALSMIIVGLLIGKQVRKDKDLLKLIDTVNNSCLSKNLKKVIIKGLEHKYRDLDAFKNKLIFLIPKIEKEDLPGEKKIKFGINLCFLLSLVIFCITLIIID